MSAFSVAGTSKLCTPKRVRAAMDWHSGGYGPSGHPPASQHHQHFVHPRSAIRRPMGPYILPCHPVSMLLRMGYSLCHDQHGTRPCSSYHREAVCIVGAAAGRVMPSLTAKQSPHAPDADRPRGHRAQEGAGSFTRITQTLDLCKTLLSGDSYGHMQLCPSQLQARRCLNYVDCTQVH